MKLTETEKQMLQGKQGRAAKKSMEILTALGEIYEARRLVPVTSVQISGVSFDNLGEAGLEFLSEMAEDGRVKVLTTLNPAGMDVENWSDLGISPAFAEKQQQVIRAFEKMGVISTCTCTPYFIGNLPRFGQHLAWAESSAVCFANSVIGARTNREGGPSALAAALTGLTPEYGLHLRENRQPVVTVETKSSKIMDATDFGVLGKVIGEKTGSRIPFIKGIPEAGIDHLKSLCASIATYGGTAMFHMEGITPEQIETVPTETISVTQKEIDGAYRELNDETDIDFVSIGCPHASLEEVKRIAELLSNRRVTKETWIHVARPLKKTADIMGYTGLIETSGAKFACDTCMVVAPLKGRFTGMATNSAKSVFYARSKNGFKVIFKPLEECIRIATK